MSLQIPTYVPEARMDLSDSVYYRHYRITVHVIERYIERIGGDVGNMIADLEDTWVFNFNQRGLPRAQCVSAARCDHNGGYVLTNGIAMFVVKPSGLRHSIVTTLSMNTEKRHE
ncbi:hypothetical protein ACSFCT_09195 [Yokenella regensburgei]|uniref:hypothetical protein n=1 Tax=Yokenella regensburgei TaxID=158877 RepID=UPI003EDA3EB1